MWSYQEFWLNLANAALGIVVLAILLAFAFTVAWEFFHKVVRRHAWGSHLDRELRHMLHR